MHRTNIQVDLLARSVFNSYLWRFPFVVDTERSQFRNKVRQYFFWKAYAKNVAEEGGIAAFDWNQQYVPIQMPCKLHNLKTLGKGGSLSNTTIGNEFLSLISNW